MNRIIRPFLLILLLLNANAVSAVQVDISTMVTNFAQSMPNLMKLITALAFVMGMFLIIKGIMQFKAYGEQKTSNAGSDHSLKAPIILLLVGTALLYLPSAVHVGTSTFWSSTSPFAYVPVAGNPWSMFMNNIFLIIEIIGTIALIRGLLILSHLSANAQQGTVGRAMAHIVGGILCINIYAVIHTVMNTLGFVQS